jgi:hypothetical protein
MNVSTSIKFGNGEVVISVSGGNEWEGGENKRIYFDVETNSKKQPISKFYEVIAGSTRDDVVEIEGRKFAYQRGFCDSRTKRKAADEAARALAEQVAAH